MLYKVNFRFFSMIIMALALGLYIYISLTSISNSMALSNLSIEVLEHGNSTIFSFLSRDFDQTIDNINNNNQNSTAITNDDEILQE